MKLSRVTLLIALCLALPGCVRIPGGIAPSNIPLSQGGYTIVGPVIAQDCKIDLFGVAADQRRQPTSQMRSGGHKPRPLAAMR